MHEKLNYKGWPNCIRWYNEKIELIATTDVGPRILHFGFINKQNFFYVSDEDAGRTKDKEWRIYGGHRLWHAPEEIPRTYFPDNDPVVFDIQNEVLKLTQPKESTTGIVKEIEICFESELRVKILHRLYNHSSRVHALSPWAISAMAEGGRAIIPQEPYGAGNDYLLPARPLVLWQYAQMEDPRWHWGNEFILARQDPAFSSEQKIGLLNKQGWAAYLLHEEIFIKKFSWIPEAKYPDFNSNNEIYINQHFLEIETLAPELNIMPGKFVEHVEYWELATSADENEIAERINYWIANVL
ncbi:MAG: hypothetical protein JST75_14760 [Bacteroidetes bacterium]|nr:hypothetical protein [Bacteroidota bacterium]